jgi:hypothetical protein
MAARLVAPKRTRETTVGRRILTGRSTFVLLSERATKGRQAGKSVKSDWSGWQREEEERVVEVKVVRIEKEQRRSKQREREREEEEAAADWQ